MSKRQWGHGFHTGFKDGFSTAKSLIDKSIDDKGLKKHQVIIDNISCLYSDQSLLICPRCKEDYLHHAKLQIYNRNNEDSENGMYFNSETENFYDDYPLHGNPSPRRNGIRIDFLCEHCGETKSGLSMPIQLCISQHKGHTYMWWEFFSF